MRRPTRSTLSSSSAASDVYKRQAFLDADGSFSFKEAKEDQALVPEKLAEYEISPYFLNNHAQCLIWVFAILIISLICFISLRLIKKPPNSAPKFRKYSYQIYLYLGNTFCWGILYYFILSQWIEGLVAAWVGLIYRPVNTRNGILNFLACMVYLTFYFLFVGNMFIMIKLCTIYENRFEQQVEKKENQNCIEQINLKNFEQSMKEAFQFSFLKGKLKDVQQFIDGLVEFYSPYDIEEKERIFLAKHQLIFACNKKQYYIQRYFLMIDIIRLAVLTFSIVLLQQLPILQSCLNLFVLMIYDYLLIAYRPNKDKIANFFLALNEVCIAIMYSTAIIFALLDRLEIYDLALRRNIGQIFVYADFGILIGSIISMIISFGFLIYNLIRFLYAKISKQKQKQKVNPNSIRRLPKKRHVPLKKVISK
eukprot:TRINITY_DN7673_c0_g1_i3.p1 TRINITY_DN7673_c0_g1~~TRINITY_DN7673_c0_g1_i3.p1  ORF type:complete len:422 (+),score=49.48 TRINITY_DN7673_c0_g1_i3:59-1324(+)